jgi:hypothetical protein
MVVAGAMVLTAATGCAIDDGGHQSAATSAVATPCPVCDNSPFADRLAIHDLNLRGEPNGEGFSLPTVNGAAQILQGSTSYDLHVVLGFLKGKPPGHDILMHGALVGAVIPIQRDGVQYEIVIREVHTHKYVVAPLWGLETYTLGWREVGGPEMNPCAASPPPSEDPINGQAEWHFDEAVMFEGDRIDAEHKSMSSTADDHWINIACAGDALSKLLATRNTFHSQPAGLSSAWQQRQAALKMFVADYCGTGKAFTVQGQKFVWQGGATAYGIEPEVLEARWTETGASCIHAPRMLYPTTSEGPTAFPDIWQALANECQLPMCTDLDSLTYDGAYFVSAKPVPAQPLPVWPPIGFTEGM